MNHRRMSDAESRVDLVQPTPDEPRDGNWSRPAGVGSDGRGDNGYASKNPAPGPAAPVVRLRGLAARKHTPLQIAKGFLPRWILTMAIAWAMYGVLIHYSKYTVMSRNSKRRFNAVITALSLLLGLAVASSLDGMVSDLRWWILSRRYRSRRKVELILRAEGIPSLIQLAFGTRRPSIFISAILWLLFILGTQIAVAVLGLCYSTDNAEKQALSVPGQIAIADMSTIQTGNIVSSSSASLAAQQFAANNYGIISTAYPASGLDDIPQPGTIYIASDPLIFCSDVVCRYAFRETSVASIEAEGANALAVMSSRSIDAQATCRRWPVTQGGDGQTDSITIGNEQGQDIREVNLPFAGGTDQTTFITETAIECGPGCSPVWAFEALSAQSDKSWYYQCNITIGDVVNATLPEHKASANLTALASSAIALQGYAVSSLARGAEVQYQSYPAESIFGRPHNGDTTSMAGLVSRFSIGSLASIAETNKPLRVMGTAPEQGTVLDITHMEFILLILQGLVGLQLLLEIITAIWAHRVIVPPDNMLDLAQVLRPMTNDPDDGLEPALASAAKSIRGGKVSSRDEERARRLAEPLWVYRATPTAEPGVYDLRMEKSDFLGKEGGHGVEMQTL